MTALSKQLPSASSSVSARPGARQRTALLAMSCLVAIACGGERFSSASDGEIAPSNTAPEPQPPSGTDETAPGDPSPADDSDDADDGLPIDPSPSGEADASSPSTPPGPDDGNPIDPAPTADDADDDSSTDDSVVDDAITDDGVGLIDAGDPPILPECDGSSSCVGLPFDGGLPAGAGGLPGVIPTGTAPPEAGPPSPPDECPDVADQDERGACGCGFASTVECEELESHLVHRYSFDGTGTTLIDTVGGADGTFHNGQLDGNGSVELDGESAYAELPAGIVSALTNATLEAWVRWDGGDPDQRIFNFGTPSQNDGPPISYISLSPRGSSSTGITVSVRPSESISNQSIRLDDTLPSGSMQHVAVSFDSDGNSVALYVQGELQEAIDSEHDISDLADANNWIGRALYSDYPNLDGALFEFRIYDAALTAEQLAQSFALGPDATFSAAP